MEQRLIILFPSLEKSGDIVKLAAFLDKVRRLFSNTEYIFSNFTLEREPETQTNITVIPTPVTNCE